MSFQAYVGTTGTHRDASNQLRLDGIAHRQHRRARHPGPENDHLTMTFDRRAP